MFSLPALYAESGKHMSVKLVPSGDENEKSLLRLVFVAHAVQILMTSELNDEGKSYIYSPRRYCLIYRRKT